MTRAALLVALLMLTGCVSVLPEARPAAPRYLLESVSYDNEGAEPVSWSLVIEDPSATRVYDTAKIALIRNAGRVEYLANGEWADRAPRLVQAALIRSFENTSRILGVGDRASLITSTYTLQTDIRALHADFVDGPPEAAFSVYARLTNARGKVIAARLFENKAPAGKGTAEEIAAAFDKAADGAFAEMVEWTLAEGEKAYAK